MKKTKYFPGLDGIRALAVILVCLDHLKIPGFGFGFVGVDIFFSLSGFLIAHTILDKGELNPLAGYISFWARRMLRIWPALFVTIGFGIAVSFLIGHIELGQPQRNLQYAMSSLFISLNYLLWWDKADYFSSDFVSPFLHLWSLSIEEQFYLFFPLLFFLVANFKKRLLVVITVFIVSFFLNIYFSYNSILNYYFTPTRIWQLLSGVLLALFFHEGHIGFFEKRTLWSWWSIFLVLSVLLLYIRPMGYPGWWGLIPTTLAIILILSQIIQPYSKKPFVFLSSSLLMVIGRRSYVIYLLHWPIILILNHYFSSSWQFYLLFLILLLPSVELVHRLVELRCLAIKGIHAPKVIKCFAMIVLAISIFIIFLYYLSNNVAKKTFVYQQMQENIKYAYPEENKCVSYKRPFYSLAPAEECTTVYANKAPLLVLWGDSHAGHYGPLFNEYARRNSVNFLLRPMGGCLPSLNYSINGEYKDDCTRFNALIVNELKRLSQTKQLLVVLSARWAGYGNGAITNLNYSIGFQGKEDNKYYLLEKSTEDTVNFLISIGAQVLLINNTPNFNELPLNCLAENRVCKGYFEPIYFLNKENSFQGKAKIIDFNSRLCPAGTDCDIIINNVLAYSDKTHLSNNYSYSLIDLLELQMK